ncbi:MAG TPA: hypothetical protein DIC22_06405 [Chitinophagaceae bacterium]|nr:hypothetical protein [Chitinophagaceae bacterium]
MKQSLFMAGLCACFLLSCNSEPKPETVKTDSSATQETIVYPFTPKYSLKWEPGDEKHALMVLNCLKHYVDGDMKETFADFADTVEFFGDKFHFSGSRDSLAKIIGAERAELSSVSKVFDTWITTFYPEQNDTWVTLWYTETWTDKKGKTDSLYYTDDVLIKNGKIVEYDEKQRQFPAPVVKK